MKKGKNKKRFLMMDNASAGLYKLRKDMWGWYNKTKKMQGFGLKNISEDKK